MAVVEILLTDLHIEEDMVCLPVLRTFLLVVSDIDQLITISGMVIRTSNIIPEMREGQNSCCVQDVTCNRLPWLHPLFIAFFCCSVCRNTESVEIDRGRIAEPNLCRNCNTYHSFQLIHNRSHFTDKQIIKLQESPGEK